MIGRTIGHYEIVEKLGEGGMGVVYKARDTSLNRFVAIKLLPTVKLGDEDRIRRFTQEARTASALNHPNIVTIHEISTHDGAPFIVMEYVPGKSLDRLIPRNGLRLSEVFKIGTQVAGALAAAAAAGVIHRDVKPGNVVVTDAGHVKVLVLYVSGTGRGKAGRPALRYLQLRRGPLRNDHRPARVSRGDGDVDDVPDSAR
jgi:serine/threonine-protein kinase